MSLTFPAECPMVPTTEGDISIKAIGSRAGETVAVRASQEAIQDYGLYRVQQVASDKYDANKTEAAGTIVRVYTADCV